MNNFFLLNEAIDLKGNETNNIEVFLEGMEALNAIVKSTEDEFQRHESVWQLQVFLNLFNQYGQRESLVAIFVNQMTPINNYVNNELTYDELYPNDTNAFLGINFESSQISPFKQITNATTFMIFKEAILWDFTFRDLWERRNKLFPSLVLCGNVEDQIKQIGDSGYLNQIVEKLRVLNNAVSSWDTGDFNYKAINRGYPLRISPESSSTMAEEKLRNHRMFSLPDNRRECFELHIKTGDLRFHFYPDNQAKIVYVGYIGPHLPTSTD